MLSRPFCPLNSNGGRQRASESRMDLRVSAGGGLPGDVQHILDFKQEIKLSCVEMVKFPHFLSVYWCISTSIS